ncbi:membrane-spanning 4-domains subfamily A member 4A-like [Pelobates fuscus]|uniref:membrane-spanning 4-domains subfamily A member 4A-like n=1 Tax=Pelobates fuscus TaxID=191477 RepID=UPI002FE48CA5
MPGIRSDNDVFENVTKMNQSDNLQESSDPVKNIYNMTPKHLIKFYKGKPKALGVTQILLGALHIIFGLVFRIHFPYTRPYNSIMFFTGLPFWSGVMYIISGSISVSAAVKPTLGKVKSNLVLNIISSVVAAIAIILLWITLSLDWYEGPYTCSDDSASHLCDVEMRVNMGMVIIIFIMTVTEFCITISTSVFGCKTVCGTSNNETKENIYQTPVVNVGDNTTAAVPTALTRDESNTYVNN